MRRGCVARTIVSLLLSMAVVAMPALADIQTESKRPPEPSIEQRLVGYTERLQMAYSLASVASYSITPTDLRTHTQQLINLLEGHKGRHATEMRPPFSEYIGLLEETSRMIVFFDTRPLPPEIRRAIHTSLERVLAYLEATLEAALDAQKQRRLNAATDRMLRAYAYLATALRGNPETPDCTGILYFPELLERADM